MTNIQMIKEFDYRSIHSVDMMQHRQMFDNLTDGYMSLYTLLDPQVFRALVRHLFTDIDPHNTTLDLDTLRTYYRLYIEHYLTTVVPDLPRQDGSYLTEYLSTDGTTMVNPTTTHRVTFVNPYTINRDYIDYYVRDMIPELTRQDGSYLTEFVTAEGDPVTSSTYYYLNTVNADQLRSLSERLYDQLYNTNDHRFTPLFVQHRGLDLSLAHIPLIDTPAYFTTQHYPDAKKMIDHYLREHLDVVLDRPIPVKKIEDVSWRPVIHPTTALTAYTDQRSSTYHLPDTLRTEWVTALHDRYDTYLLELIMRGVLESKDYIIGQGVVKQAHAYYSSDMITAYTLEELYDHVDLRLTIDTHDLHTTPTPDGETLDLYGTDYIGITITSLPQGGNGQACARITTDVSSIFLLYKDEDPTVLVISDGVTQQEVMTGASYLHPITMFCYTDHIDIYHRPHGVLQRTRYDHTRPVTYQTLTLIAPFTEIGGYGISRPIHTITPYTQALDTYRGVHVNHYIQEEIPTLPRVDDGSYLTEYQSVSASLVQEQVDHYATVTLPGLEGGGSYLTQMMSNEDTRYIEILDQYIRTNYFDHARSGGLLIQMDVHTTTIYGIVSCDLFTQRYPNLRRYDA